MAKRRAPNVTLLELVVIDFQTHNVLVLYIIFLYFTELAVSVESELFANYLTLSACNVCRKLFIRVCFPMHTSLVVFTCVLVYASVYLFYYVLLTYNII